MPNTFDPQAFLAEPETQEEDILSAEELNQTSFDPQAFVTDEQVSPQDTLGSAGGYRLPKVESELLDTLSQKLGTAADQFVQTGKDIGELGYAYASGDPSARQAMLETTMETGQNVAGTAADMSATALGSIPVISPLARTGVAKLGSAVSDQTEEEILAELEAAQQERIARSPIAAGLVGQMAGALGGGLRLPGAAMPGAAGVGVGLGYSAGDQYLKTGDIDPDTLTTEALVGGGLVGVGKAAGASSGVSNKVADWLKSKAVKATEDVLAPTAAEISKGTSQRLAGIDPQVTKSAEALLDKNLMGLKSTEQLVSDVQGASLPAGRRIEDMLSERSPATGKELSKLFRDKAKEAKEALQPEVAKTLLQEAKTVANLKTIDPTTLSNRKRELQSAVRRANDPSSVMGVKAKANLYADIEEGLIPPEKLDAFRASKKEYGDLAAARDMLIRKQGRYSALPFSQSQFIKENNATLRAAGLYSAFKGAKLADGPLRALSEAAQRNGAKGVISTHYLLMQQDPKYRESIETTNAKNADKEVSAGTPVYSTEE